MRLVCALIVGLSIAGCVAQGDADAGASVHDAAPADGGLGDGSRLDDARLDGPTLVALDTRPMAVDAPPREGGGPLPPGRVTCYWGPQYNCDGPGEDCCESRNVCWTPAEEPDFCPEG